MWVSKPKTAIEKVTCNVTPGGEGSDRVLLDLEGVDFGTKISLTPAQAEELAKKLRMEAHESRVRSFDLARRVIA
ncbi:hypothetical protein UFOVP1299_67 [uncultured Caudovirales phage]|uniref:Uncharacterized protein n=1 Tax=uncultured Caudovirales phage TaxID=2100421 RepID=A0A6J5RPR7_9CAUD|nr:hypothetical protein UFOVP1299_67 [uncultured Caudovirales phage]